MQYISTEKAPRAIGPYSQAVIADNTIYASGQIALDPETMELSGTDVASQTDRVLRNLAAVLKAAGSSLEQVVRTTVYLIDMADFAAMNEVYSRHFGGHRPARSTVAVASLPKGARVEIDAVAVTAL